MRLWDVSMESSVLLTQESLNKSFEESLSHTPSERAQETLGRSLLKSPCIYPPDAPMASALETIAKAALSFVLILR